MVGPLLRPGGEYDSEMRGSVRLGLASAVLLTACGSVPFAGWDPEGRNQLVTYGRIRADGGTLGVQVGSAGGGGSWTRAGLPTGCQTITYPWSISVGPADGDRSRYEEVLNSGSIAEGTTTVWMDVAPDGTVSVGWGEPPVWGADLDPADGCGDPR